MVQQGTVIGVENNVVTVEICRKEACESCKAASTCKMLGGKRNNITVECHNSGQYNIGDTVEVSISEKTGRIAVLIAYVAPLIVLVIALATAILCGASEALAALIALCITAIYYLIIYLFRNKIKLSTFNFQLSIRKWY